MEDKTLNENVEQQAAQHEPETALNAGETNVLNEETESAIEKLAPSETTVEAENTPEAEIEPVAEITET
ncbi:MAG: hypothetical protein JXR34_01405, partial [Bacteroidales bacterium]|nr:hypothetical protein [Bacteroidales bacterium]